ncbi:MAG: divergent polysaccharide deacetylase family protein [Sneathiellaceae bacterium]
MPRRGRGRLRLRGEQRRGAADEGERRRRPWPLIAAWLCYVLVLAGGGIWLYLAGPLGDAETAGNDMQQETAPAGPESTGTTAAEGGETVPPPPSADPEGTRAAGDSRAPAMAEGSDAAPGAPDAGMPAETSDSLPQEEQAQAAEAQTAEAAAVETAAAETAPEPMAEADPAPPPVDPLRLAQSQGPLAPAPDPKLQEQGVDGILPRPGPEGELPWQVYARPFEAEEGRPRIAIVFGGLGLDSPATVEAIQDLPGEVTLALSPYASSLDDWVQQARSKGHEVLLVLPVQPPGYPANDPGPHALLADLKAAEAASRLRWTMARAAGYVGLATETVSPVTENAQTAEPLLKALKERGLLFFDGGAGSAVTAAGLARTGETPFAAADLVLDAEPTPAAIDAALADLERLARENGQAVGFARAYPVSIDRIAGWALALEARGFALAPLTGIIASAESG